MKYLTLLFFLFSVCLLNAQEILGTWHGMLKVQGIQLPLVIHISQGDTGLTATMDSPDQGATGIEISSLTFTAPELQFEVTPMAISYTGQLTGSESIEGTFTQMGQSFPLNFTREPIAKDKAARPQEPKEPYPYYSEEVTFHNPVDDLTLAGTLTLPSKEGTFPVVILISGSGPQNRDEEVFDHKPFLVLSDHLTRKGIGVLRYDDRGTAESTGDYSKATSEDLARDVLSAVDFLKTHKAVDAGKIGLVGHSEGGLIAPMVANTATEIAFIVLLAGPGIPGFDILMLQSELIREASGITGSKLEKEMDLTRGTLELVRDSEDIIELRNTLNNYLKEELDKNPDQVPQGMAVEDLINTQVNLLATPWMQFFLKYDPAPALEALKCPVLALNGEKDLQVPPKVNLEAIDKSLELGGNPDFTVKELPSLNHLFQTSDTGAPTEYATLEETFAEEALLQISDWILKRVQ